MMVDWVNKLLNNLARFRFISSHWYPRARYQSLRSCWHLLFISVIHFGNFSSKNLARLAIFPALSLVYPWLLPLGNSKQLSLLLVSVALRLTIPLFWQGVCDMGDPGDQAPPLLIHMCCELPFIVDGWMVPSVVPTHRDLSPGTSGPLNYSPTFDWPQLSTSQYPLVTPTWTYR